MIGIFYVVNPITIASLNLSTYHVINLHKNHQ